MIRSSVDAKMGQFCMQLNSLDTERDSDARGEVLEGGGRIKLPCVKIGELNGEARCLCESEAITQYLEQRFAH